MEESTNEKNNHELKSKDDDIPEMENIMLEISESMASLQNKIETLQVSSKPSIFIKTECLILLPINFQKKRLSYSGRQTTPIKLLRAWVSDFSHVHHLNHVTLHIQKRD